MSKPIPNSPNGNATTAHLPAPAFDDPKHHLRLYQGDCLEILAAIPENSVDLVFADPPYFLSNGGITCHAGKMVSVHKGDWDKSRGPDANHEFNRAWLAAAQRVLKPNNSISVFGTACNPNRATRERNCLDSYLSGDYAARQFPVVPQKTVK